MSLLTVLLALASASTYGLLPVPPESIADFTCAANATAASRAGKTQAFFPLESFYHGRLSVRDERRDWNSDITWMAATNDPSISMTALKECAERYTRYLMLDGKIPR